MRSLTELTTPSIQLSLSNIIIIIIITEFLVRLLHEEHRCITES